MAAEPRPDSEKTDIHRQSRKMQKTFIHYLYRKQFRDQFRDQFREQYRQQRRVVMTIKKNDDFSVR